VSQNKLQEAAITLQKAIDSYDPNINKVRLRGPVYLNLGLLLNHIGRQDDSRKNLAKAVEEFRLELANDPNSVITWLRLGEAFGTIGDLNEAANAFAKAVALEPGNIANWSSYAHALEFQGRLDEAIIVTKESIEFTSRAGDTASVAELNKYLQYLNEKKTGTAPK
jgi:tetratricopeptide (TPR) repeat protein